MYITGDEIMLMVEVIPITVLYKGSKKKNYTELLQNPVHVF